MKMFSRILSLLVIASLGLMYTGCGKDDGDGDPKEKVELAKLSKTWNISSATLEGDSRTSDFTGFKLTLSGAFDASKPKGPYQYTVSGTRPTPNPWPPAGGTWTFGSAFTSNGGTMVRSDGVAMTYTFVGSQLKIALTCSGCNYDGSARVGEVDGDWIFIFDPA
jgi:hypothetical protein